MDSYDALSAHNGFVFSVKKGLTDRDKATAYDLLDASLTKALAKPYREVLLFGDFNSHIDWWGTDTPILSDAADDTLLGLVSTLGLSQICRSPTYIPSSSFLDLVFVSHPTQSLSCDVYTGLSGSDHLAIELAYAMALPRKGHFARAVWKFHRTDREHMARLSHLTPWCMTTMGDDCLENMDLWCDYVCAIQKECVPCVVSRRGRSRAPWITKEHIRSAQKKRALFKRAARLQCAETLSRAKALQRSLKADLNAAETAFANTIAFRARKEPKVFWSYVSQSQTTRQEPIFTSNGRIVSSPGEIADMFAPWGISQGSVLGPTLFNVYVRDIPQSDRLLTIQYADDTTLAMCIRSPDDLAAMQAHLDKLAVWSATNHLRVSHDKCAVMRFSSARKVQTPHYTLGGLLLPPVQELNILGVSFTPSLDFSCHVAKVVSRSHRVLGFASRFSRRFGRETLKTLYTALVLPRLEYCSSIWSPHQIHLTEHLESVQRRATRTLARHDHSSDYDERLQSLGWHRLSHRRTVARVRLVAVAAGPSLAGSYGPT
ncbi:hypothetical protein ISCGN_007901 [Ixodes scapularis]